MVAPPVLARPLHRHQIVRLLHDAEQARVARGIVADPAGILVGHVEAAGAVDNPRLHVNERVSEVVHGGDRLLQEMEGQPLRGLGADPRQALERLDQPRDGRRVSGHAAATSGPGASRPGLR